MLTKNTLELHKQYEKAIPYYLKNKSIVKTCNMFNFKTRRSFSNYLKSKGIDVINFNNQIKCNENKFNLIDTEEQAYWLGFLYADGYINNDRNRLELGLKESDIGHIEKFKKFIQCTNKITLKTNKLGNSYRIGMSSKQLITDLNKLGCVNCKSLILKFPNYNQVPKKLMSHFMRGYFDGDGYLGIREEFRLKDEVIKLYPRCAILGTYDFIYGYLNENDFALKEKQLSTKGKIKQYTFNCEECYILLNRLYKNSNIYLDRKYEKYINIIMNKENLPSL